METSAAVLSRRSVRRYDPDHLIDDDTLRTLFELVRVTPSSFNLQHWSFIVVREAARKASLREVAYGQPQVKQASAVVLVCGKLDAHEDASSINATLPSDQQHRVVETIHGYYAGKSQPQRDEAIRSGSLAAMSLMIAAEDMGLATGPMIGFDPQGVRDELGLPENYIPVMMIVLGKRDGDVGPRQYRRPLSEIVKLEHFTGPGLNDD